jgi:hypothetical protein
MIYKGYGICLFPTERTMSLVAGKDLEKPRRLLDTSFDIQDEIWTWDLINTRQEWQLMDRSVMTFLLKKPCLRLSHNPCLTNDAKEIRSATAAYVQ